MPGVSASFIEDSHAGYIVSSSVFEPPAVQSALTQGHVCRSPDFRSLPSDEEWYSWDGTWQKSTSGVYAGKKNAHTGQWKTQALDDLLAKLTSPGEVEWSAKDTYSQCYPCKEVEGMQDGILSVNKGLTKLTCGYELQKGVSKVDTSTDAVTDNTITKMNVFTTFDCDVKAKKVDERVFYKAVTEDRLRAMQGFLRCSTESAASHCRS